MDTTLLVSVKLSGNAYVGGHSDNVGIGLAISGGVDSMALAALCSQLQDLSHSHHQSATKGQPLERGSLRHLTFQAFIVDHGLRSGSDTEAEAVSNILKGRGNSF
jgi:tRNA(Ile)-lysidine synthase